MTRTQVEIGYHYFVIVRVTNHMWNFFAHILKLAESIWNFISEISKEKPVWKLAEGIRVVFVESRCPVESEEEILLRQCRMDSLAKMIIPAVKYPSVRDLQSMTTTATAGCSTTFRAVADSYGGMDDNFLKYVNRREKEGHNLYFDIHIDKREIREIDRNR